LPEASFTANILAERLESLFLVPKTLESAQVAAWKAGKPDAAGKLANAVIDLLPNKIFFTEFTK
jgi:UDP-N-acetylglucosamine:LPS N-acetylglucosamine transferase